MTLTIRETRRIEWSECDPIGIMFYPQSFRWFDDATHHLFAAAGCPMNQLESRYGIAGCPLVDAGASFKSPLPWTTEIAIETQVAEWRGRSFIVTHRVWKGEVLAIEGREVRVCVARDGAGFKGVPIPDDLKASFA